MSYIEDHEKLTSIIVFTPHIYDFREMPEIAQSVDALHFAALSGSVQLVEALLHLGHSVLAEDALGRSPLVWALGSGRPKIVDVLLQNLPHLTGREHQFTRLILQFTAVGNFTSLRQILVHIVPQQTSLNLGSHLKLSQVECCDSMMKARLPHDLGRSRCNSDTLQQMLAIATHEPLFQNLHFLGHRINSIGKDVEITDTDTLRDIYADQEVSELLRQSESIFQKARGMGIERPPFLRPKGI